jgi:hypothetical protein
MAEAQLVARFALDKDQKPKFERDDDDRKHFEIRLSIRNAPTDAHAVTYQLHETYYDPVREARQATKFPEWITSYGDFKVKARVRRQQGTDVVSVMLSDALEAYYRGEPANAAVARAIDAIREN